MNDTKLDELVCVALVVYSCRPECHTNVWAAGPIESQMSGSDEHAVVFRRAELVAWTHTWTTCPDGGQPRLVVIVALAARAAHQDARDYDVRLRVQEIGELQRENTHARLAWEHLARHGRRVIAVWFGWQREEELARLGWHSRDLNGHALCVASGTEVRRGTRVVWEAASK
eukprot:scaffold7450_cov76-Phaeocystis_antarctica.AAC.3